MTSKTLSTIQIHFLLILGTLCTQNLFSNYLLNDCILSYTDFNQIDHSPLSCLKADFNLDHTHLVGKKSGFTVLDTQPSLSVGTGRHLMHLELGLQAKTGASLTSREEKIRMNHSFSYQFGRHFQEPYVVTIGKFIPPFSLPTIPIRGFYFLLHEDHYWDSKSLGLQTSFYPDQRNIAEIAIHQKNKSNTVLSSRLSRDLSSIGGVRLLVSTQFSTKNENKIGLSMLNKIEEKSSFQIDFIRIINSRSTNRKWTYRIFITSFGSNETKDSILYSESFLGTRQFTYMHELPIFPKIKLRLFANFHKNISTEKIQWHIGSGIKGRI